jgi:hypothetical protein
MDGSLLTALTLGLAMPLAAQVEKAAMSTIGCAAPTF